MVHSRKLPASIRRKIQAAMTPEQKAAEERAERHNLSPITAVEAGLVVV